ncbi:hypothetical protein AAFF_G00243660 [Aldrovandia affinis]|uniref:Uncharacterized protein n=1 Tax=Aldrovandia affinis TaxID=143900 RepID=A0AAD7RDM8_9TELE|nr:hypothetical protein AAFF_G00243660 [Aldrovandia affinis]
MATQLKTVVQRYFYALDMDAAVQRVTNGCHQCAVLKKAPVFMSDQSTGDPPEVVGSAFAADVLRRERQFILAVRECVTSFTLSALTEDEHWETLRGSLLRLCLGLCPLDGPFAVIRTDPAPGFAALAGDEALTRQRLVVEVGNVKNVNKNPVAEKAVQELQAVPPSILPGDLVYLYGDRNKSKARDRYLVSGIDGAWCSIQKFTGSQLHRTSYRVRLSDCYKVEGLLVGSDLLNDRLLSDEDSDDFLPCGPDIPPAISEPPPVPYLPSEDMSLAERTVPPSEPEGATIGSHEHIPATGGTPQRPGRLPPSELERVTLGSREHIPATSVPPRRSGRHRQLPRKLEDFVLY